MSIFRRLFRGSDDRAALAPLYEAIVREAREPGWYREGAVPDTLDGRFDMVAAVLALVLIRLDAEGDAGRAPAALLTELFVDDMDGQLRQIGIGDFVVGKHIGRMMSALGGRIAAYREGLAPGGDAGGALTRNIYRGDPPADGALSYAVGRIEALQARLATLPLADLLTGRLE